MIETEVMSNRFIGDGNNKTFAFGFRFNNVNDIQVWLYDSTTKQLTQRRDFTLSPNSAAMPSDGGTVTFPSEGAAIPSTQMVIIQRHMNLFQLDVYKHGMFLDLDNFERSLDTLVLEMQQINDSVERAIKVSIVPDAQQVDPMIPPLEAGQTVMVSEDGTHFVAVDIGEIFATATSVHKIAEMSRKWAEASDSPDGEADIDSVTGKTQSSKSWSLYSKDRAIAAAGSASSASVDATAAQHAQGLAQTAAESVQGVLEDVKEVAKDVNVFVPDMSPGGTLTWTNKAGLENPEPVNLMGPQGATGPQGPQGIQGPKGDKGDKGDAGEGGVQIDTNAFCLFSVRDGHLICTYQDGQEKPNFSINEDGHLIYTIE